MPKKRNRPQGNKTEQTHKSISKPFAASAAPDISFPVGTRGEKPEDFIRRVKLLLDDPQTAVYIDTSFAMWLTKGSELTRQQFYLWLKNIGASVHVPLWTYHEYYRHHKHGTLLADVTIKAKALSEAAKEFCQQARTFADHPHSAGQTESGFHRQLVQLQKQVQQMVEATKGWDYEKAAEDVSAWLAAHLCRSRTVFDLMNRLGQVGEVRFTQDIPPGFLDRIKVDTPAKGSNQFGDLILWEEVLANVPTIKARNVIILTRDRKLDWFAKGTSVEIDGPLKRLLSRWEPVPAPHPTMLLELSLRTDAKELVLLDDLYSAGVLWETDPRLYSRYIGYALKLSSDDFDSKLGPTSTTHLARSAIAEVRSPNLLEANTALKAAYDEEGGVAVGQTLAHLNGPLHLAEQFIDAFNIEKFKSFEVRDAAVCARKFADAALDAQFAPIASKFANRLLELVIDAPSELVAAVLAGFIISAYYDKQSFRPVPKSWQLQSLYDLILQPNLDSFRKRLNQKYLEKSPAPYIPSSSIDPIELVFKLDNRVNPSAINQITFANHSMLQSVGPTFDSNLRKLLGGASETTAGHLFQLISERFGLPLQLLRLRGIEMDGRLLIPETLGLFEPEDLNHELAAQEATPSPEQMANDLFEEEEADVDPEEIENREFLANGDNT